MAKTQRVAISHNSVVIAKHRASAVKCLSILAVSLAYHHLHSFKSQVTKSLGLAVDDPKRVVRVLARKTRNIWLTMKN